MSTTENQIRESLLSHQDESSKQNQKQKKLRSLSKLKQPSNATINGSSIFQNMFFTWIFTLLKYGSKKTITEDTMPGLPAQLKTEYQYNKLHATFSSTIKSKKEGLTLTKALARTYLISFLGVMVLSLIYVSLGMFNPFLTSMIMKYINQQPSQKDITYGEILFITTFITCFIKNLGEVHLNYRFSIIGINMTNSLTMMIYQKSLKYASLSEKSFTEADIINYSQVDAQRMTYMGFQLMALLVAPIQIVVGLVMMYNFIGVSFVAGIGAMIFMILCSFVSAKRSVKYNEQVLKVKDERMNVTQQMLDIIRYIKINAIQKFFYSKVDEKRMKEIDLYKKKGLMDVVNIFIYWLACPVILSATFFTYIQLGNQINSEVAFTTIMIFSILQYPIRLLPNCISEIIQIYSSIKRIQKYLLAEEIKTEHIQQTYDSESSTAVKIQQGDFYWGLEQKKEEGQKQKKEKEQKQKKELQNKDRGSQSDISDTQSEVRESQIFTEQQINNLPVNEQQKGNKPKYVRALNDINTTIQKGKFTILIGDIGSGKSSLLLAILNQMRCSLNTRIQVNGSIAYASQKPWIMSGTVLNNIIFTQPYDELKFNRVIHYASLEQDIKILPKGVETEIGQKGVNLSGGQKARISLARTLYSNRDIYLLDDILSAVDVHVGQFLMKQTLLTYLKGKTIIMPTHAIKFAQFVDQIIIMKKGKIVRKGHYNDICKTPEFEQINRKQKKNEKKSNKRTEQQNEKALQQQFAMMKQVMKNKSKSQNKAELKPLQDRLVEELMLPEDQVIGKVDLKIFKEYIDLNGGTFRFAFLVCLAMLLWIVSITMASIVMERWCQDPMGNNYQLYIYIVLSIFSNVFIFFRAYTLILSSAKQGQTVHKSMVKSLLYASLANFYNRIPIGRIINRLTKDLRQLDQAIGFAIGNVLVNFFSLLSTLTICVYGSTPYVLIPIAAVLFISNRVRNFYMRTQRQVSRLQKSTNSPIVSGYMSAISGLSTIRAYRKQSSFTQLQMNCIDLNKKVRLNKSALQSWFSLSLTYLAFLINMTAVGYCILSNNGNASLAGLLMNYALNASSDIIYTILSIAYFQTKIVSLERIYTFMKIPPEQPYVSYCSDWTAEEEGYRKVVNQGQIQFRQTCVKYRKDLPIVLNNLNCTIKKGQKVGIVGRTGAGKTTIINTLLRVTEIVGGDILVDGKSIGELPLKDLRNDITMIDQEPTLIKSTFRENLDITGKYTNQQLENILKQCNLYNVIIQKGGLEGKVSNDSLSAGQKQLLCICRAFLKKSKIVLIDEATANIDLKNDQIIQKVILEKFKQCTVLTIAHRLSTLKNSDKILVMQSGKIMEFGSPSQLQSKANGFYKQMLQKNASQFLI